MANALAGVGGNLDINSLVSKLMAVERAPIDALATKTKSYQSELSAYGTTKGVLSSLQSAARTLSDATKLPPATATSSNTAAATASAQNGASAGTYTLDVQALAQAHKLYSAGYSASSAAVGGGTMTIELGTYANGAFTAGSASPVTITIDPAKSTLADVRDAINNASAGVSASIVNDGGSYRLVMTSKESGAANSMRITTTDADGDATDASGLSALAYDPAAQAGSGKNLTEARAARDAQFTLDGLPMTRPSNTVTDVVDNVTFALTNAGTTTVTVTRDPSSAKTSLDALITAYNAAVGTMKSQTAYDATSKSGGPLQGESVVRSVVARLRSTMTGTFDTGSTTMNTLSSLGISFGADGKLAVTTSKYNTAYARDPAAASKLLSAAGTTLNTLLTGVLGEDGAIAARTSGIQKSVDRISTQQTQMENRMTAVEARYRAQFTSLDSAMSSMTNTLNYLKSQFSSSSG